MKYHFVKCLYDENAEFKCWIPSNSIIYHKCSCGVITSHDSKSHNYRDHLLHFEVEIKSNKRFNDTDFNSALLLLKSSPSKYQSAWD